MKHLLHLLIIILTFNCSSHNLENISVTTELNKKSYSFNDSFELTIRIQPVKGKEDILLSKYLDNFEVSFSPESEQFGFEEIIKDKFIEHIGPDSIHRVTLTKTKPYKKTLNGKIIEVENKILFEIPAIRVKDEIDKSTLISNPIILIEGGFRNANDIEIAQFKTKRIKVRLSKE